MKQLIDIFAKKQASILILYKFNLNKLSNEKKLHLNFYSDSAFWFFTI